MSTTRETRIRASRVAQLIAASVYLGFVAVATPLMGLGTEAGADATLLDITDRVLPLLSLPLVISAVLSQFSAATADTAAAAGNLHGLGAALFAGRAYLLSGVAAIVLCWTVDTLVIVTIASRAFAAVLLPAGADGDADPIAAAPGSLRAAGRW